MFKVPPPPLKKRNGSGLAESDFEKAGEFNGQFTDVFTKTELSQVPLLNRKAPFMEDIVVSKEGVTKLLKGLDRFKPASNFVLLIVPSRYFCSGSFCFMS